MNQSDKKITELSEDDLEQVAGGAAPPTPAASQDITVNKAKTANKAYQAMDGFIRG